MKTSYLKPGLPENLCVRKAVPLLSLPVSIFFILFFFPAYAAAVPAAPEPVELAQADGSRVKVFLRGDEFYSWHEDEGGYTIVKDTDTKNWVYTEKDQNGQLKKTARMVGRTDPGKLGSPRRLLDDKKVSAARAMRKERDNFKKSSGLVPASSVSVSGNQPLNSGALTADGPLGAVITSGTMRNLVILAKFADQNTTYTQAQFDSLFNQPEYTTDGAVGSVRDFYTQASYNKLTMETTVTAWVTLPQGYAYYGVPNSTTNANDVNPRQMVLDAINALDATGFDFSTMDGNGDGQVDGLDIIHSGRGQEYGGNDTSYIWSHKWQLSSAVTKDGVTMQVYHTEPEVRGSDSNSSSWGITRIGVICHETGHFLGLPDLYDYGGDSAGVGDFCLMASGSWNGNTGTSPAHPSAYCKKRLGWATPTTLSSGGSYSLARIEDNDTAMYKFSGAGFAGTEYFLVENKQSFGFDASLPGSTRGILIWHVDEAVSDSVANNDQTHYKVDLEEASGTQHLPVSTSYTGDDSDYFRSTTLTTFDDTSNPNSQSYAGLNLNKHVSGISASGNPMTFNFTVGTDISSPTAPSNLAASNVSSSALTLGWTASTDDVGVEGYRLDLSLNSGFTSLVSGYNNLNLGKVTSKVITGLTASTPYYARLRAYDGALNTSANSTSLPVTTLAPPDTTSPSVPTGLAVSNVSSAAFTLGWTAATDNVAVTGYRLDVSLNSGFTSLVTGYNNLNVGNVTSKVVTGLSASTIYYARLRAYDAVPNTSSSSSSISTTTLAAPDTTPPSVPTGLVASNISSTAFTLGWNASTDNVGVTGYLLDLYLSSGTMLYDLLDLGNVTSKVITGLSPGTLYYAALWSYDAAENTSDSSSTPIPITTLAAPDTTPPSVPTGLAVSNVSSAAFTLGWNASTDNVGVTGYKLDVSLNSGFSSFVTGYNDLNVGNVTSKVIIGLSASTTYYARLRAYDAAANTSASSSLISTATLAGPDTTPPVISSIVSSGITYSSATITWTTNEPSDSQVEYGLTTAYGNSTTLNASLVTSHSAGLTGLSASTVYHYRVKSKDTAANLGTSIDYTFTTTAAPDITPPVISIVVSSGITYSSATITWITNELSDSQVEYGLTTAYGNTTVLKTILATSHSAGLTGLSASTIYHYRAKSRDASGNLGMSVDYTFTTAAAPDTTPPVISGVGSSGITYSSATITWTTNELSDSQIEYGLTTSYGNSTTLNTSMVTSHSTGLTGLSASTVYHYRVKSRDASANLSASVDYTFLTAPDTTPPVISGVGSSGVTYNSATITWTTNEPSDSQVEYGLTTAYGNSTTLNTGMATSHGAGLTGLSESTVYHYRVKSRDASANLGTSVDYTFLTAPDTTQPVISGVGSSDITYSSATITWTTDELSDSQVEYGLTTAYGNTTTLNTSMVTSHSAGLTGLSANALYHYRVKSRDAFANLGTSIDYTFTTAAAPDLTDPSVPSFIHDGLSADVKYVSSLNTLSANWGASTHSSGINHYEYCIGTTSGAVDVSGWTSSGLLRSVTKTGLSLTEGSTYYFSARAYSNSGHYSSIAASDGQRVDVTSPTASIIVVSALPAGNGSFAAKLIVTEAGELSSTPALEFITSGGQSAPLSVAWLTGSTWTAAGFIESYYSTGTASFAVSAVDGAGNTGTVLTSGVTFNIDTVLDGTVGGVMSNSDGFSMNVPAGAVSGDFFVNISTVESAQNNAADALSPGSLKLSVNDLVRDFSVKDIFDNPIHTFSASLTITLSYPDADAGGMIDGDNVRADQTWIYWLDEAAGRWAPVDGVVRHPELNTLTAVVNHLSRYSIRQQIPSLIALSGLKAYPNPCDFNKTGLTIAGIPPDETDPKVYVYNMAGELVRTLKHGDGIDSINIALWDGRVKGGIRAASGLYIYHVRTEKYGKGSGKFVVLW